MRKPSNFMMVTTGDGSPSLAVADDSGYVEKMHHTAGAMSETLYIYAPAIEMVFTRSWPARILSLGLGLGYNEILAAAFALKYKTPPESVALFSFESEPVLRDAFLQWLRTGESAFAPLYEEIVSRAHVALDVPAAAIREWLCTARAMKAWQLRGAFPNDAAEALDITCVLYDAFSNKMTEELWTENFLVEVMNRMIAENCVFATYAATGALNRALRALGFQLLKKPGFAGKRESTMAVLEK